MSKITEVKIVPLNSANGLLGLASVVYDNALYLGSIGIFRRSDGSCRLTYPIKPTIHGKIHIYHPINKAMSSEMEQMILEKLNESCVSADIVTMMGE